MSKMANARPEITTVSGKVAGTSDERGVLAFKGVPYAADTAGANRFLPPQPRAPWSGTMEAITDSPCCPQMDMGLPVDASEQSEDCLRLSIWTRSTQAKRPVMVWLHGGAFRTGNYRSGGVDGANLVAHADVVMVGVNHRIAVMGHLQLGPEYGDAFSQSGNVGMLDIAAALAWVRDNIANFGGDPDNVTVFGISGGGSKTLHAMAMPAFKGLFHRAIAIDPHEMWKRNTRASSARSSKAILDRLGIVHGDIAALQALPFQKLIDAQVAAMQALESDPDWDGPAWAAYDIMSPVIDGDALPQWHIDAIAAGASASIDLMLMSNQLTHWLPQAGLPDSSRYGWLNWSELEAVLRPYLRERTTAIIADYRAEMPGATPSSLLATLITDREWLAPVLQLAEARAASAKPAYMLYSTAKGTHLSDLLYSEAAPNPLMPLRAMTATPPYGAGAGHALTGLVIGAVVNFATTGNPASPDLSWTPYTANERSVLMLGMEAHLAHDPFATRRKTWNISE